MGESSSPGSRRLVIIIAAVLAVAVVGYWLASSESEEAKIRRALEAMRVAVEEKHARNLVWHIDESYSDASGWDKQTLRTNLAGYFLRTGNSSLACVIVPGQIEVAKDARTATASFRAAVYEGITLTELAANQGAARGQGFAIEVELSKGEDGEWRVTTHSRKPFPANDIYRLAFGGE